MSKNTEKKKKQKQLLKKKEQICLMIMTECFTNFSTPTMTTLCVSSEVYFLEK